MNAIALPELPNVLHALADGLSILPDRTNLPPIVGIRVGWDEDGNTFKVTAQLAGGCYHGGDFEVIAGIGAWATALGGFFLLGEECRLTTRDGYYWRNLSAVVALPGGFLFEVWAHLYYPVPAETTEMADLVTA
jgi:hypothetical protein